VPKLEQVRDAAAAGREAGKKVSRAVVLLATIGAVVLARVLYSYGWGFWPAVIACAVLSGVVLGVVEGLRMVRSNRP
jgi:hypothetical protein